MSRLEGGDGGVVVSHLVVFVPMLWSLSTTERSMLVTETSVDTFTLSFETNSEKREKIKLRERAAVDTIYHKLIILSRN